MITNEEFLAKKVNPILEPLAIDLLMRKPEDPVDYMIDYLDRLQTDEDEESAPQKTPESKDAEGAEEASVKVETSEAQPEEENKQEEVNNEEEAENKKPEAVDEENIEGEANEKVNPENETAEEKPAENEPTDKEEEGAEEKPVEEDKGAGENEEDKNVTCTLSNRKVAQSKRAKFWARRRSPGRCPTSLEKESALRATERGTRRLISSPELSPRPKTKRKGYEQNWKHLSYSPHSMKTT
eukprot:TRINITY_DN5094_c0_g1_i2.p1 TRINITY_DN5094_c0_g1~~TRINITY_DN5094_c0_g1_i2.p1  ORF type:complete len:240 (-),score=75.39 TRINITY_DN5094_c0_g1_i2:486-1205(-)